jgi:predicted nucleic acid-binding Zn ribbon protein
MTERALYYRRISDLDEASKRRRAAPADIQKVLGSVLKKFGLDHKIAKYEFVTHWREIVGDEIASRTTPECIRGGSLVVRVCNSVWAQELSFQKDSILKRLKRFNSQHETINDVTFYVGDTRPTP